MALKEKCLRNTRSEVKEKKQEKYSRPWMKKENCLESSKGVVATVARQDTKRINVGQQVEMLKEKDLKDE